MKRAPIAAHRMSDWIGMRCELAPGHFDQAGALWDSWRQWARRWRAEAGTPAEFAEEMERRGFTVDRLVGDRHRIRWGIRLRTIEAARHG